MKILSRNKIQGYRIQTRHKSQTTNLKQFVSCLPAGRQGVLFLGICLFLVSCFLVIAPKGADAQSGSFGFSFNPQKFDLVVFPGETVEETITLGNKSDLPMPVSVASVNFSAVDGSGEMIFEEAPQDDAENPASWVNFETPDFILGPNERRELSFSVDVPEDASLGGYYVFVYFEPRMPDHYFEESDLQSKTIPVVGVPFLISTTAISLEGEEENRFEVADFYISPKDRFAAAENVLTSIKGATANIFGEAAETQITRKQPSEFVLTIKNNDVYHIRPFGTVGIYNMFGRKIGEAELGENTILPGKTRDFPVVFYEENFQDHSILPSTASAALRGNLSFGRYKAVTNIEAFSPVSEDALRLKNQAVLSFYSLPWQFLGLALLFVIFALFERRRLKPALKALFSR